MLQGSACAAATARTVEASNAQPLKRCANPVILPDRGMLANGLLSSDYTSGRAPAARETSRVNCARVFFMRVLAIESSCDESAAAVLDARAGLLAHELFSQVELHRLFGGVVPELASREHVRRLLPLVRSALQRAGTEPGALDGVAYTCGPGLIGALLTGASLARSLAYAWGVPAIGVHHLEGHLLAPLLEPEPPPFPHVALLVSGGHTLLLEVLAIGSYRVV